jgi:tetratricopeptide (TPR) repeat protein
MLFFSACARVAVMPEPDTGLPAPALTSPGDPSGAAPDARMAAAHSLTVEGYRLFEQKDYDGAIRTLERAVGINPADGPAYFYLAEAWLQKENLALAARFNELATLYLRNNPAWSQQAEHQKKRIKQKSIETGAGSTS